MAATPNVSVPKSVSVGFPFLPALALLFIGLKLTGHVAWSWAWVLSPLWLPLAVIIPLLILTAFFVS